MSYGEKNIVGILIGVPYFYLWFLSPMFAWNVTVLGMFITGVLILFYHFDK